MSISIPAAEAVPSYRHERAGESKRSSSLTAAGRLLKRGYDRVCSAIFDPDGDCTRF